MYTDVLGLDLNSQEIKDIVLFYRSTLESLVSGEIEVCYGDRAATLGTLDLKRLLFEVTKDHNYPKGKAAPIVHSLMASMFYDAEKKSPIAGLISMLLFTDAVLSGKNSKLESNIHNRLSKSSFASYKEWSNTIHGLTISDNYCKDIFNVALHLGGACSKIQIKKDTSKDTVIESISGHTLGLGMHTGMVRSVDGYWNAPNCSVCLVDGIVENVGEIHHLLEFFNKSKTPLLIAARGFSDDVVSTLSTNMARKTLNCMPFVVGVNERSVNTLADMGVLCGCDVVSSLKGELISSIDPQALTTVDRISHSIGSLTISCNPNPHAVSSHKLRIEEKMMESHEIMSDYFLQRINFLSGECTVITLGKEHGDLIGLRHDRLESLIAVHNSICSFGITYTKDIPQLKCINDSGIDYLPAKSLMDGYVSAITQFNLSNDISHFIIKD